MYIGSFNRLVKLCWTMVLIRYLISTLFICMYIYIYDILRTIHCILYSCICNIGVWYTDDVLHISLIFAGGERNLKLWVFIYPSLHGGPRSYLDYRNYMIVIEIIGIGLGVRWYKKIKKKKMTKNWYEIIEDGVMKRTQINDTIGWISWNLNITCVTLCNKRGISAETRPPSRDVTGFLIQSNQQPSNKLKGSMNKTNQQTYSVWFLGNAKKPTAKNRAGLRWSEVNM